MALVARNVLTIVLFLSLSLSVKYAIVNASLGPNIVTDWNTVTQSVIRQYQIDPQLASRYFAFVHLSIHRTLSSSSTPSFANKTVAANFAAHYVLSTLFPTLQSSIFDKVLRGKLKPLNLSTKQLSASLSLGKSYALSLLKSRLDDGIQAYIPFVPYPPGGQAGKYQYTPGQTFSAAPQLASAKPISIKSAALFDKQGGPHKPYTAKYNLSVEEVVKYGNISSRARNAQQTETAKFWADLAGTAQISGHWFNITATVLPSTTGLKNIAKVYAAVAVAQYDASIAGWYQKYKYVSWRPITAIRADVSKSWTPLLSTPPHPDYPSGHSVTSASSAYVLAAFLKKTVYSTLPSFTIHSEYGGGVLAPRSYRTLDSVVVEDGLSRIYAGVHFRKAVEDGNTLGYEVGKAVFKSFF